MFWLRNKEVKFSLRSLNLSPVMFLYFVLFGLWFYVPLLSMAMSRQPVILTTQTMLSKYKLAGKDYIDFILMDGDARKPVF